MTQSAEVSQSSGCVSVFVFICFALMETCEPQEVFIVSRVRVLVPAVSVLSACAVMLRSSGGDGHILC